MIDLSSQQLMTVRSLLERLVPSREVRAFGSRVTGKAQRFSDLDLVIMGDKALAVDTLEALRDGFSDSELPFTVDVLDWCAISESFREVINDRFETIER